MPCSCTYSVASSVVGMLAPSARILQPFFTRFSTSSMCTSFWVAQGSAMSQGVTHTPRPSWYSTPSRRAAYSVRRPRSTSLTCLSSATSMPAGSYTQPVESDTVTTLAPSCWAFCVA